jgi:hypothetical protein
MADPWILHEELPKLRRDFGSAMKPDARFQNYELRGENAKAEKRSTHKN